MTFLGGAIVGLVAGLGAAMLFGRRRFGRPSASAPSSGGALAITIAVAALVASGVALARSGHDAHTTAPAVTVPATTTPGAATATTSAATAPTAPLVFVAPTTTPTTASGPTVPVPNVVTFSRDTAVTTLGKAGLKAKVETLSLANVPTGFVVSQTPLPATVVSVGSTVSLEVSSPG